jgi:hypothetical protein
MDKNPFSLYDFLGYLFPGAILLILIIFIKPIFFQEAKCIDMSDFFSYNKFKICAYNYDKIRDDIKPNTITLKNKREIEENPNEKFSIDEWTLLILFILFSYILGHLVSYLSSQTVEFLSNKAYGYPSKFLLSREYPHVYKNYTAKDYKSQGLYKSGSVFWRIIVVVMFHPLSIFIFLFGKIFNINAYIARPLDDYLIICIESKIYSLPKKLKVQNPPINLDFDFHRIVMHYVYQHISGCQRKIDNYVSLYGFLRCITFIGCVYVDVIVILCFCGKVVLDVSGYIEFAVFVLLIDSFYMAYLKFYRRFTLENYMALLSDDNLQGYVYILYPKNWTGAKVKKYFISLHHIKERVKNGTKE